MSAPDLTKLTHLSGDRLVIIGATGTTGRRVLRLASDAGLRPIAVGRRAEALSVVAAGLDVEVRVAGLHPRDLDAALEGAAVVVGAVGPATQYGPEMLAAALRAGAHWIDFSGEPRWVQQIATRFQAPAVDAGMSLIPSLGLGVAGDLAAARAATAVGEVRRITVAYRIVGMKPSVASARSSIEIVAGGAPLADAAGVRFVPTGRASAPLHGIRFPFPDALLMHTRWPDAEIQSVMETPLARLTGTAVSIFGAALRRPAALRAVRQVLGTWADRPHPHTHSGGGRAIATVLAEGSAGSCMAVGSVTDLYEMTAQCGFHAAKTLLGGAGAPGLRSWTSVVGSGTAAADAVGVVLH